jgi:hypothetical protein
MTAIPAGIQIIRYNPQETTYRQALASILQQNPPQTEDLSLPQFPIKEILLCSPYQAGDNRWDTIELTGASLFLGSALQEAGYNVNVTKQPLPAHTIPSTYGRHHLLGFTLFEETIEDFIQLTQRLDLSPHQLLAAGGPLATLHPLLTAYHIPRLNLLVRGEAELVFPKILDALKEGDLKALLQFEGLFFQIPGLIILSHLDKINQPRHWDNFNFSLDFLERRHLEHGLEINLSRGCRRGCIFCAKVQGRNLRALPPQQFEKLLIQWKSALQAHNITSPFAQTVNINDDDILQDPQYAKQIFHIIKQHGFRLWGIQTSINSLFTQDSTLRSDVMELIDDSDLFVNGKKLLWLGTDTFLQSRGKKLAKQIPPKETIRALAETLGQRGILHYHYWISSDEHSHWQEFIDEFSFIARLKNEFPTFHILAHAPFLVPYLSTPLHKKLTRDPNQSKRIVYRNILKGDDPNFDFPLAQRVETPSENLNRLLNNTAPGTSGGFFDHIKANNFLNALMVLYHYLKQERFQTETNQPQISPLKDLQTNLEDLIASMM